MTCVSLIYNSEMLAIQYKFESHEATFRASRCYILKTHKMRVKCRVILWCFLVHVHVFQLITQHVQRVMNLA